MNKRLANLHEQPHGFRDHGVWGFQNKCANWAAVRFCSHHLHENLEVTQARYDWCESRQGLRRCSLWIFNLNPTYKSKMMSKVRFCFLLPLNPAWFASSLFFFLHFTPWPALPPIFCFFLYRFLSDQTQSAACMLHAGCYCSSQVRWNPRSVGLTSSAISSTLLEPNKDIFYPSLFVCSHAFTFSGPSNTRQPCHVANMLRTRPQNYFVLHSKCAINKWKVNSIKKTPCNE